MSFPVFDVDPEAWQALLDYAESLADAEFERMQLLPGQLAFINAPEMPKLDAGVMHAFRGVEDAVRQQYTLPPEFVVTPRATKLIGRDVDAAAERVFRDCERRYAAATPPEHCSVCGASLYGYVKPHVLTDKPTCGAVCREKGAATCPANPPHDAKCICRGKAWVEEA